MMDTFSPLTGAAIVLYVQRYLKTFTLYQRFVAAMPGADKRAHQIISALMSLVAGVGITVAVTGDWDSGWHFAGQIPSGPDLLHGLWHACEVFAVQQFAYDATKDKGATHA